MVINGGVAEGKALVASKMISTIHMTGGKITHDIIVWGFGPKAEELKAAKTPLLEKPITSELGAVSPWIIVPSDWSETELEHHAKTLAVAFTANNSCNCCAPSVLVLPKQWSQTEKFIERLKKALSNSPL